MRRPTFRKRRAISLGDLQSLREQAYALEGERYLLTGWTLDMGGQLQLNLLTETAFRAQYEVREQSRQVVDLLRAWRSKDGDDA